MANKLEQLEALQDIRKMMKESSRFLSLSGISGILAGVYALIGAFLGHLAIQKYQNPYIVDPVWDYDNLIISIAAICVCVLILSFFTVLFLSGQKARKNNYKLFDHSSRWLLWSMIVPLIAGGIFCLALLLQGGDAIFFIAPSMLIFYGLSLISSSRLTLHDIKYLGYLELVLGLIACFLKEHGLLFWTLGFGILHLIYGSIMWYKYDRKP
ncbi:MAG: hypothetical protein M3R25_07220 [Bacteroidota bacterium]|nr:hypothetical protein [Bacteroidota bacterium]